MLFTESFKDFKIKYIKNAIHLKYNELRFIMPII